MTIVLQFYPNGEFTQGVDTVSRRKSRPESISDEMHERKHSPLEMSALIADMNAEIRKPVYEPGAEFQSNLGSKWIYLDEVAGEFHFAVENSCGDRWVISTKEPPERLVGMGELAPPLVYQTVEFSQTPSPSRKKCLNMTKSMGRNIRNACYLLEQEHGKDSLSFLTLTLPDLPPEGLEACAANWGKMVDQFLKWLRSKVELKGIPLEYVYCTEIQTKRLEKYGQIALHLHLLFRGKPSRKSAWVVSPSQCRKAWVRCIKAVYNGHFRDCALENLQRIRKSAGAYMSKYLSKGNASNNTKGSEDTGVGFQGHWGGMARNLSRAIKRATIRIGRKTGDGELAAAIERGLRGGGLLAAVWYYRYGFIPTRKGDNEGEERGLHVGVGCLKRPVSFGGLTDLLELCYASPDLW